MYKGRTTELSLAEQTFKLARPSFSQMFSAYTFYVEDDVEALLKDAVPAEVWPTLENALDAADHEDAGAFIDTYTEFAGFEAYRKNVVTPREQRAAEERVTMFRTMQEQGLLPADFITSLLEDSMTPSLAGTTSTEAPTDGAPRLLTTPTTG